MPKTIKIRQQLSRSTCSYTCGCGGYCEQVETTDEEFEEFGCDRKGFCDIAFVCKRCGKRYAGKIEAPEAW